MKVTVNETQSNEVDWSKNPQLVFCDGFIVLVHKNKSNNPEHFTGTRVDGGNLSYYATDWIKEHFKPFHGSITLSND